MQLRNDDMQGFALFPPRAERQQIDDFLTRRLADADARIRNGSVTPTLAMAGFRNELAAFDFREPRDLEQSLSWRAVGGALTFGVAYAFTGDALVAVGIAAADMVAKAAAGYARERLRRRNVLGFRWTREDKPPIDAGL